MAATARFSVHPPSVNVITTPPDHHHRSSNLLGVRKSNRSSLSSSSVVVKCGADHHHNYRNFSSSVDLHRIIKNKVFEDRVAGIVCYRDADGEITCEGYDEGPRLHHYQFSTAFGFNPPRREVGIVEILERCWVKAVDADEMS